MRLYLVVVPRSGSARCEIDYANGGGSLDFEIRRGGKVVYEQRHCAVSLLFSEYQSVARGAVFPFEWGRELRGPVRTAEDCGTTPAPGGPYSVVVRWWGTETDPFPIRLD